MEDKVVMGMVWDRIRISIVRPYSWGVGASSGEVGHWALGGGWTHTIQGETEREYPCQELVQSAPGAVQVSGCAN
jgi:hypothetical protein